MRNAIVSNPFIWGALVLCSLLLAAAVYVPILAEILNIADPGTNGWLLIFLMSLLPVVVGQAALAAMKSRTNG